MKTINEDIVGWIKIEDTNINYPILKDRDVFYINHSYDKKYSSSGAIFSMNINPFEDSENIIYGHNMKNGSMFSHLSKYWNEKFFYNHLKFNIYTPSCNYEAVIFSVYSIGINEEENNIKQLSFDERIQYYKKMSKYNIENIDISHNIVKLSTCSYINAKTTPTNQRYYIIAYLLPL